MEQLIHAHAIIDTNANIAPDVKIGAYCIIGPDVSIARGCILHNNVIINGNTTIGEENEFHPFSCIGGTPQDVSYTGDISYVEIGDKNIFREYTTVHRGTKPKTKTIVGNNNYFMVGVHIGHNCSVGNNNVMVNYASLGGYATVAHNAFISSFAGIHQFVQIGDGVMLGGSTVYNKDVPPYMMARVGRLKTVVVGLNIVGIRRMGVTPEEREKIKRAYKILYHNKLNVSQALQTIKSTNAIMDSQYVQKLVTFVENSERGITPHFVK